VDYPIITSQLPRAAGSADDAALSWNPPALRAVCLDIDDTLVDFTTAERQALTRLLGRSDTWPLWQRVTATHVSMVVGGELGYDEMHHRRSWAFLVELGFVTDESRVTEFERRRRMLARLGWKLFPDVRMSLDWLTAAGVRLAAVTNASGRHQYRKLAALGICRYFDHIAVAGELGVSKPDPVMFQRVCAEFGCQPAEAAHIGDKLTTDARGAQAAGLTGVWLHRGGVGESDPAVTDVPVVTGLDRVPELLVREFGRVGVPVPR